MSVKQQWCAVCNGWFDHGTWQHRLDSSSFAAPPDVEADVIKLYVVEYEHGRNRYHTVVEARGIEAAKRQFRRDNPHVEILSVDNKKKSIRP